MHIRGNGRSAARIRGLQQARRNGMLKAVRNRNAMRGSSSTGKVSHSNANTSYAGSANTSNKVTMYESMQKTAKQIQSLAQSMQGFQLIDTSKTQEGTGEEVTKLAQELEKLQLVNGVSEFVSNYNALTDSLVEIGGSANAVFCKQLNTIVSEYKDDLTKLGISQNKRGDFVLDKTVIAQVDSKTIADVFCAKDGMLSKLSKQCATIEESASACVGVLGKMYGTQSYTQTGSAYGYYGANGSLYNARG